MNIEEYISSGILELYALDLLSKAESREVALTLENHPEIASELKQIELTLESYVANSDIKPSPELKSKVVAAIKPKEVSIKNTGQYKVSKFVAIAASLLLLISLGYNYVQYENALNTKKQLTSLQNEQNLLVEQNNEINDKINLVEEKINLYQNPEYKSILIKGTDLQPESFAYISYNKSNNSIYLSGINLPKENENSSYQLWALVDGTPVDLGIFNSTDSLIKISKTVKNAGAFAVTLQDKGGNPTPNLEQLYLIGNV